MPVQTKQPRLKNLDDLFLLNNGVTSLDEAVPNPKISGTTVKALANNDYAVISFELTDNFPRHPFRLYTGQRKEDMTESIRAHGILQPLILRDMSNGRYQILSGHNRKYTGMEAGLTEGPAVIKHNLTDGEAWVYVIETNLMQRSFADMSHSEKAAVLALHHSKMFSQGKRTDILRELQMLENPHEHRTTGTSVEKSQKLNSRESIAQEYGLKPFKVAQYLRVFQLTDELKCLLDDGVFELTPAVALSFLSESEQQELSRCLELNGFKVDVNKANILRQYSEKKKLDNSNIYLILNGEIGQKSKPNRTPTVKVSKAVYTRYFRSNQPAKEIQEIVEKALELYFSR